jgi:putative Holliday junction resolvase
MRTLGVDYGEKRVGLALSDPEGRVAVPLATLERRGDRGLVRHLARLCHAEGVERIVVGQPLGDDGTAGPAAQRTARFAATLARVTGLPCRMVDERLTSHEAEERLRAAGVGPRRRRAAIDSMAAQILLQEALDTEGRSS